MNTGIYAIENLYSGWVYVGATKDNFRARWRTHCSYLRAGHHTNDGLRAAAKRYGSCGFRFMVLQELPRTVLMAPFEQFWIDYLKGLGIKCYNRMTPYETPISEVRRIDEETAKQYPYTVKQMAERGNVSHGLVSRLIKSGEIRAVRDWYGWHVSRDDYQAFPEFYRKRRESFRLIAKQRRAARAQ